MAEVGEAANGELTPFRNAGAGETSVADARSAEERLGAEIYDAPRNLLYLAGIFGKKARLNGDRRW